MDRKTATVIFSFALFGSFFLPLFRWDSFEMTGMNYILSTHIPPFKYLLLLIPLPALFLFFGALNDENYFFSRKLLSRAPFLALVLILILRYTNGNPGDSFSGNSNLFSGIELGFWLALCFSILLMIAEGKKKIQYVTKAG